MQRGGSGTRCSTPPFMRSPGMVQVAVARSISARVARRVSDVRTAHKTVNSKASFTVSLESDLRRAAMKDESSGIVECRMVNCGTAMPGQHLGEIPRWIGS